jgi:signal peptidase I
MGNSLSSGTVSRSVSLKVWFAVARRVLGAGAAVAITLVFLGACVVAPLLHIGFSPVLTGSMRPAYAPGDLLITAPADVTGLRPGQIAVFTPPGESVPYAHRITAIAGTPAQPVLTTKGDANPAPDAWQATLNQTQVPVVVATVPSAGTALLWIQNPAQRALLTAVFGLVVTGAGVRWILRAPSTPPANTSPTPAI